MLRNLIKTARLPECSLVTLLCLLGFAVANTPPHATTLAGLFCVVLATMIHNDWRDRLHDLNKGKTFAADHPTLLAASAGVMWIVCLGILIQVFSVNRNAAVMLFAMMAVGLLYSEARRIPFLSITLVTLTVASATLTPIAFGASLSNVLPLFVTTVLIMFGRENLHDINDVLADRGYKKTIPVVLGDKAARIASAVTLTSGCITALSISYIATFGICSILYGLAAIKKDPHVTKVRKMVDVGMVLIILGLLSSTM